MDSIGLPEAATSEIPIRYPIAYLAADAASLTGQRRFTRTLRIQLLLLLVAGAAGVFTWTIRDDWNVMAMMAGAAFSVAGLLRFHSLSGDPQEAWYEGRAVAESIKTLSWRYMVGGFPFPRLEQSADDDFVIKMEEVVRQLPQLPGPPVNATGGATEEMKEVRASSLQERKGIYRQLRITDQRNWYSSKAIWNAGRAKFWGRIVLLMEVIGAAGAFLQGFGVLKLDLFGLLGAAAATGAAWLETKQHANISQAYGIAGRELDSILSLIDNQPDEAAWASFVSDAEDAISREHTLWRASKR